MRLSRKIGAILPRPDRPHNAARECVLHFCELSGYGCRQFMS